MFHLTIPEFVVICVGGAFIGSLILFSSWRKQVGSLLSGFLELFMQDVSKTPEGARANYAQSISEEQEKLGKVNDALISLAGQLKTAHDTLNLHAEKAKEYEAKTKAALSKNDMESARTFGQLKLAEDVDVENAQREIKRLTPMVADAQQAVRLQEEALSNLKLESKRVVAELETNQRIADAYTKMSDMKISSGSEKMLNATREGLQDSRERAAGAKLVYSTTRKGREEKANEATSGYAVDSYLDSLRKGSSKPITYDIKDPNAFSKSSGLNTQSKK